MPQDLSGKKFGRWTVLQFLGNRRWLCRCDCGVERPVLASQLTTGRGKSCGCLRREKFLQLVTKHGGHGTRLYSIWKDMIKRCDNPNHAKFADYGGRGISVVRRWRNFANFRQDMGEPPTDAHEINRIDNDGDYCPDNCEWVTRKEQMRNIRRNRMLTHDGKTQCLSAWAEETGLDRRMIADRLAANWPIELALTLPKQHRWSCRQRRGN